MQNKDSKTGKVTYHHQMLGAAIVHPDFKEVIPLLPEPIIKQDGETKNDCERNAGKRFFKQLRKDHPHLPIVIVEDGLSSNAPHIRELMKYNCNYSATIFRPQINADFRRFFRIFLSLAKTQSRKKIFNP